MSPEVGSIVTYTSGSGKVYEAKVVAVLVEGHNPNYPPRLSLEFRNDRGKLIRKQSVLHASCCNWTSKMRWEEKPRENPLDKGASLR